MHARCVDIAGVLPWHRSNDRYHLSEPEVNLAFTRQELRDRVSFKTNDRSLRGAERQRKLCRPQVRIEQNQKHILHLPSGCSKLIDSIEANACGVPRPIANGF